MQSSRDIHKTSEDAEHFEKVQLIKPAKSLSNILSRDVLKTVLRDEMLSSLSELSWLLLFLICSLLLLN